MNLFAAIVLFSSIVTPTPPPSNTAPINPLEIYTYKLSDMDKLLPESDAPKKPAQRAPFDYIQRKLK